MRRKGAACQEDVSLALDDPEELAEQKNTPKSEQRARIAEIKAWPDEETRGHHQARSTNGEQSNWCPDEGPHPETTQRACERGHRPCEGAGHVCGRLFAVVVAVSYVDQVFIGFVGTDREFFDQLFGSE